MNAARAKNTGLELEGKWAVSNNGTVNFALGLLNATYDSFVFPVVTGRPDAIDYAGKSLDRAPKSTLILGYAHDWNLSNGAGLTTYIGARYSASYVLTNFAVAIPVQYTQDAFTYTDINATYTAANDKWSVQGFVKNLANKTAMTGFSYSSLTGSQVYLNEPRTFGLRATVRF
jgi:iron complex outermembrane receptor protein